MSNPDTTGYKAQPQMSVNGGNRNAANKPYDQNGERDYSHGLFDCCDDAGKCVLSCFCPCVVYQQNKSRLSSLETTGQVHPAGGEPVGADCAIFALLGYCGFHWVLQMGERAEVRRRYKIKGETTTDCLTSWCCAPCALTQDSREIEGEEQSLGGVPQKA